MKNVLVLGMLLLAAATSGLRPRAGVPAQAMQTQVGQAGTFTDQIVLKYKALSIAAAGPAKTTQMGRINKTAGVSLQFFRAMSGEANVLRLPAQLPLEEVQVITAKLMSLPEVEYAEPDQILFPAFVPDDLLYGNQWDLHGTNGINIEPAWDISTGSSNIVVADIDTGIIKTHEDLSGRTLQGFDFITIPAIANDGDGRDNDPSDPGDWLTGPEIAANLPVFSGCRTQLTSSWHGTHTAGTIGASGNNNLGVAGINWSSPILPVRVLGKCGGFTSDILDGVRWAAGLTVPGVPANAHPAKVMNLSFGERILNAPFTCSAAWQNAINDVTSAGSVVVAAAGNNSEDASKFTPANCNDVITVAATNQSGGRANYSNFGALVEISAPGGQQVLQTDPTGILSTLNTGTTTPVSDTYAYYQGTSMAAPHVTGVVSLMFSVNPLLTPAQVLLILQTSARAFPAGSTCNTTLCGRGMLDAGAAVSLTQHEYTLTTEVIGGGSINRDKPGPYHYGDVVQLTAIPDPGWKFLTWSGDLSGSINPSSITIVADESVTATFMYTNYLPLIMR